MTATLLGWLIDVTLKGSLLMLLVAAIQRLIGARLDPRWRHLLWLLVLVRLLMPAAPPFRWSLFNFLGGREAVEPVHARVAAPLVAATDSVEYWMVVPFGGVMQVGYGRWIVAIWMLGAIALLARMFVATIRTHRALARTGRARSPSAPRSREDHDGALGERALPDLREIVRACALQLGIRREVRAIECDLVVTPALHGVFRPVILLPHGVASTFDRAELRHIVLHELWHLRRHDVALSWILSVVQALHWFNPLVWFAAARIREERELACDELALSCLEEDERSSYGMTILKLLERFRAPAAVPALVGIVNEHHHMKRRMTMIASFRSRARLTTLLFAVVATVGLAGLTDAAEMQRMAMRHMAGDADPALQATVDRIDQSVSLDLTDVSFAEFLNVMAGASGVTINQAPGLASHDVQKARFTLHADNVPVHVILMESLAAFKIAPKPEASGVTLLDASQEVMLERMPGTFEKHVVIDSAKPGDAEMEMAKIEAETPHEGTVDRMMVKSIEGHDEPGEDGHIRREIDLSLSKDGVKTEGKLTLDIATK